MGLAGLTLAWEKAEAVFHWSTGVPTVIGAVAATVFVLLAVLYVIKWVLFTSDAIAEYHHPVRLNFLPAISISMILLSIVALHELPPVAEPLFLAGIALHITLTLIVLNDWFNKDHFETVHLNPAWFIPIVGNVLVPLTGAELGYVELSWFFFSIGIVFWLILFAIITNRVLFHHPLPERLAPTLFILVAPPAVGFLSYVKLTGEIDAAARILFYFALFMTLFLATQVPRLMKVRFYLSWWAYSFPLAAITVASLTVYGKLGGAVFQYIALALLGIVTAVIAGLFVRTLVAIARREICLPE